MNRQQATTFHIQPVAPGKNKTSAAAAAAAAARERDKASSNVIGAQQQPLFQSPFD